MATGSFGGFPFSPSDPPQACPAFSCLFLTLHHFWSTLQPVTASMIPSLLAGPSPPSSTLAAEAQVLNPRTGYITPLLNTQQCSISCDSKACKTRRDPPSPSGSSLSTGLLTRSALATPSPSPIPKRARLFRASLPFPPSFHFLEGPHSCQPQPHQAQLKFKSCLNPWTPAVDAHPVSTSILPHPPATH